MGDRRQFLKIMTAALGTLLGRKTLSASPHETLDGDRFGVLMDLTQCIGCRKCEWACNDVNGLPNQPIKAFDDPSVFESFRRPTATQFTVVNRYEGKGVNGLPLDVKVQCMHCEDPACVSACIVGALRKDPRGPVTYDAWKCIGCRYCMVACPFDIPAYEYSDPLTPRIMKCTLCFQRTVEEDKLPACAEICPRDAITFGTRFEILKLAHERIKKHPNRYLPHVYGEKEVGGTTWMYVSNVPFEDIDLPVLSEKSPTQLTEPVQHGIFKWFNGPILLFAFLGLLMRLAKREEHSD